MRSLQWYKRGAAYEPLTPNREGCVRDKFPILSISHAYNSLIINTLSDFFLKIVMGDR